jgi:cyclic-di-AMP phosphodiesterase PgpH
MSEWIAAQLERLLNWPPENTIRLVRRVGLGVAVSAFVLICVVLVSFDALFPNTPGTSALRVGVIARQDVHAPINITYISDVLTAQRRATVSSSVPPVYDAPDPNVARQQTQLARQVLDFIANVRADTFATPEQKRHDLSQITALNLSDAVAQHLLNLSDDQWSLLDSEIVLVLERTMRGSIRNSDLPTLLEQLPTQVSVRFSAEDAAVIIAIVSDLARPNTFENPQATTAAREAAAAALPVEQRTFEQGQIVIREGTIITALDDEALQKLGLLQSEDRRLGAVWRALVATLLIVVVLGLYVRRFHENWYLYSPRLLVLLGSLFLLVLIGARFLGINGLPYVFPTAVLALIYTSLVGPNFAIVGVLCLALLVGVMAQNSLELSTMTGIAGMIGALMFKRTHGVNYFFGAGAAIVVCNLLVLALFHLDTPTANGGLLAMFGVVNGLLTATVALAVLYIITQLFNLPTSLKLLELSNPGHPLLQRLLREAPGTYQHSLQVANLAEQAANQIGAEAELVRVSALYHDIGKMLNPMFFVENQADHVNPHDALNDPYRSADIILDHVREGDELASQYALPARVRDFIREHHGTTLVAYFYRQAVHEGGDQVIVNPADFTYPGPRPQSRETAILMLADSCESTVRARRPNSKQEVADIVAQIVSTRTQDGQLDDSGLTLHDLKVTQKIFVDTLQGVFHPRINYPSPAVAGQAPAASAVAAITASMTTPALPVTPQPTPPTRATATVAGVSPAPTSPMPVAPTAITPASAETPPRRNRKTAEFPIDFEPIVKVPDTPTPPESPAPTTTLPTPPKPEAAAVVVPPANAGAMPAADASAPDNTTTDTQTRQTIFGEASAKPITQTGNTRQRPLPVENDDESAPLPSVPRLRRTGENRASALGDAYDRPIIPKPQLNDEEEHG